MSTKSQNIVSDRHVKYHSAVNAGRVVRDATQKAADDIRRAAAFRKTAASALIAAIKADQLDNAAADRKALAKLRAAAVKAKAAAKRERARKVAKKAGKRVTAKKPVAVQAPVPAQAV